MTKNEFLVKFALNAGLTSLHQYRHNKPLKQAAVLIPLIDDGNQLYVLLTKRSMHLRHHPGQVAFPGGKVEEVDINLMHTASRETHEEIGLPPNLINVIGNLHSYEVISGFEVTPFIAFIPNNFNYIQDDNEVSDIFKVPLKHFRSKKSHIVWNQATRIHSSLTFFTLPALQYMGCYSINDKRLSYTLNIE